MAQQKIVWTVLPYGRVTDGELAGRLRCSIVVSPRLTPASAAENVLSAFPDFLDWPARLAQARFSLTVGPVTLPLAPLGKVDKDPWDQIFGAKTPVTDFAFTDMSAVNLRSYSVRNVLRFIKASYGALAATSGTKLPTLLPYSDGTPALRDMLEGLGTPSERERRGGFDRLLGGELEKLLGGQVFRAGGGIHGTVVGIDGKPLGKPQPLRALPPDKSALPPSVASQFRTDAEYDFYQANRFYGRPENALTPERRPTFAASPQADRVKPALTEPALDFHRIVAAFADLPGLMRRLGLVIDVALPEKNTLLDALHASGATDRAEGTIGLAVTWPTPHAPDPDAYPTTAYAVTSSRFVTRARSADVHDGELELRGAGDLPDKFASDFDLYQIDPDGTALKTVGFVLSAQHLINRPVTDRAEVTYTTGDEQGVAALRSGGLGVSRHGRAQQVAADMAAMALKNQALAASPADSRKVALFAEDVQRGYRVDVLDAKDGHWRSLCRRQGDYTLVRAGKPLALPPDEGYVKGASTTSGDKPDEHYLHESMFRWTGWSLVAPRPGRTIRSKTEAGTGLQSEEVVDVTDQADQGTGVVAKFRALPGSLPRLRFGHRYQMRARLVDLAGNSLDVKEADAAHATDRVVYRRFEPVDPPALVQRARLSEGESIERLVIRSDFDMDTATFNSKAGTPFDQTKNTAAFDYTAVNERHVVPPKASQLLAETHSMLDAAFGGGPDAIAKMYEISTREAGTLFDSLPGSDVQLITPPGTRGVLTTTLPLKPPSPDEPTGERLVGGQYVIHAEKALRTPYLPDPAAGGVALRHVPGLPNLATLGPGTHIVMVPNTEERVLLIDHDGDWPDRRGVRIVLTELGEAMSSLCQPSQIEAPPKWLPDERVLHIFLPKGRIAHLQYASFVDGAMIGQFGIPSFAPTAALAKMVALQATYGVNFLITPYRPLTLVHATQHPVCEPAFLTLGLERPLGASYADLHARVRMHGPSTGKFEILGRWTEWIDDPAQGDPRPVVGNAQLAEQPLPENFENLFPIEGFVGADAKVRPNRHEFGDTKFRLIRYHLLATTRFREYLPPSLAEDPANITRIGPALVPPPDPVDSDPGHPVVFTPSPSEVSHVVVPCSARPQSPRIVYIVPTFQWIRDQGNRAAQHSTRYGDGLRIYLERPWFSSGDGELLGVALLANAATPADLAKHDEMKSLVSQWGIDPVFDADLPPAAMRATNFPAAVASETATVDEIAGKSVFVVGHRVQWDAGRKLWYCDVELSLGRSYFPFVRLALVRYQPHALPSAKISRIVLADFAQVAPRRTVSAERSGAKVQITVRGPAPERGSIDFRVDSPYVELSPVPPLGGGETGRNRIEIALQSRDGELASSDLGWHDDPSVAPVSGLLDPPGGAPAGSAIGGISPAAPAPSPVHVAASPVAGAIHTRLPDGVIIGPILDRVDPPIWTGAIALPQLGSKEARLVVREYERYYADRTVPAHFGSQNVHQRVVEERLVYAEFFPL
jgi:hypothetical protein